MSLFSKRGRYAERDLWIPVGSLKIGMFVCALDRSWLETPFPLQGFMIRSLRDIETLKLYCDRVTIQSCPRREKNRISRKKILDKVFGRIFHFFGAFRSSCQVAG